MKKVIIFILVTLLLVSVFPLNAFALADSGSAGENSGFEYDSNTGTVIVRPINLSKEASIEGTTLCCEHCIKHVVIEEGITRIGTSAFCSCYNMEDLVIKEGTTTIGSHAFEGCESLKFVDFPASLNYVGDGSFYKSKVTTFIFRGGEPSNLFYALNSSDGYGEMKVYTQGGWRNRDLAEKYGYQFYNLSQYTGTMQSYGSLWVIVGVSAVALAAVAVVLEKKKNHV